MPEQEDDWVELLEVDSTAQADLVKSVLAGSGIDARIPHEFFSLIYGGVFGIKLMVRRADLERAKELLAGRE
ncbi:MAG TPA: DUF2007 domain-containing protein [Bacillota bacterium]